MNRPLAFSTLGCPGAPLDEVIALATATGCTGVELRHAEGEPVRPGLSEAELAAAGRRLSDAGITPLALAGYVRLAADGPPDAEVVDDIRRDIDAAHALGARHVRLFPGGSEPATDRAAARLAAVADAATAAGVVLLLETHDSHRRGTDVAAVLRTAAMLSGAEPARPSDGGPIGAIWDVLHTWLGGETPAETAGALAPWLGYVQLKDVPDGTDRTPVAPGAGALPLAEVLAELDRHAFTGWLSLEYERAWFPGVPPLADVLPSFVALART